MIKILITGSRNHPHCDKVKEALKDLCTEFKGPFIFIHGACFGFNSVDMIAHQFAMDNNIEVIWKQAEWTTYGKAAGPIRNAEMAKMADICWAFPYGKSPGTRGCIKIAESNKLIVRVIEF